MDVIETGVKTSINIKKESKKKKEKCGAGIEENKVKNLRVFRV